MIKKDIEIQILKSLLKDALKLKNMPQDWKHNDDEDDNSIRKIASKTSDKFNWMGVDDDKYDYCERQYDAWGVLYECETFLALEDSLNELLEKYGNDFPNSKIKGEVDGCKCVFSLDLSVELDDKDYEKYLDNLDKKKSVKKINKNDGGIVMSEKGREIIGWLQLQERKSYSAREISEGLFCSSRAIPGAMKKLIVDGLVDAEKDGNSPNQYKLTDVGIKIDLSADVNND